MARVRHDLITGREDDALKVEMPDEDIAIIAEFLGTPKHKVKAAVWLAEAYVADHQLELWRQGRDSRPAIAPLQTDDNGSRDGGDQ